MIDILNGLVRIGFYFFKLVPRNLERIKSSLNRWIFIEAVRQTSFDIYSMYLSFIYVMQPKRQDKLWLNKPLYLVIGFIARTLSHITFLSSGQKLI